MTISYSGNSELRDIGPKSLQPSTVTCSPDSPIHGAMLFSASHSCIMLFFSYARVYTDLMYQILHFRYFGLRGVVRGLRLFNFHGRTMKLQHTRRDITASPASTGWASFFAVQASRALSLARLSLRLCAASIYDSPLFPLAAHRSVQNTGYCYLIPLANRSISPNGSASIRFAAYRSRQNDFGIDKAQASLLPIELL